MLNFKEVDAFSCIALQIENTIWNNPEIGFKEYKTSQLLKSQMQEFGYSILEPNDITGFIAEYDSKKQGPTLVFFAELDSLTNTSHADCDKQTGAVHSCGHHVQCASLIAVAGAIMANKPDIVGKIRFCFVPAEEGIDFAYRKSLVDKNVLTYTWGKPEFIKRGYLDGCDLAVMIHAFPKREDGKKFYLNTGNNGNVIKQITLIGKSAHAGGSPHLGINALNMATTAISTINSLRETFVDSDHVRFHSIITHGGDSVNTVPEKIVVNSYVRAGTSDALISANDKINRAIKGVALAFGGNVIIEDRMGSLPVTNDKNLTNLACEVLDELVGSNGYDNSNGFETFCTDFGDVCSIMPGLQFFSCGMSGPLHGSQTVIDNHELSVIESAKAQYGLAILLLKDNAKNARAVIENYKPRFSKQEYLKYKSQFNNPTEKKIEYLDDHSIVVKP